MTKLGKVFISLIVGLWLSMPLAYTQKITSRAKLEKEKKQYQAKINQTQKILANTQSKKQVSVRELKSVTLQIENQEDLIKLLEKEINLLEEERKQTVVETTKLNQKLQALRKEYAEMIYLAGKASGQMNQLTFLFSANSFQEMYIRYKYLQQYTESRKQQLASIQKVANQLNERRLELFKKKQAKEAVLTNKQKEFGKLRSLVSEKEQLLASLGKQEERLRKEIAENSQAVRKLDNLISSLVSKEIAKSKKVETKKAEVKSDVSKVAPSRTKVVSKIESGFAASKNQLPWPVSSGFISDRFGIKNHPVLPGVKIDNNGIDIQTLPNASVLAVHEGKVLDISEIPGLGKVVAIQHDDYYTVYANLEQVSVEVGADVSAKMEIGKAGMRENVSEINFQIWHQFDRQNPENWLIKK
ncbi:MAG: murein hydrolase activator EnvC family protein [Spirosomataceae bacterium]